MVVLVATAMLLTGLPGIYFAREKAKDDAIIQLQHITKLAAKDFEHQTSHLKNTTQALEAALRSSFDTVPYFESQEDMNRFKENFTQQVVELLHLTRPMSLRLVFNTDHVEGAHTISFYDRNMNGIYVRSPEYDINTRNLAHPSMQWWTKAVQEGETWTQPYFWREWNMKIISFAKAVYIDSMLIACLGSDMNFDNLAKKLDSLHTFETGSPILLDENLEMVYYNKKNDFNPSSYNAFKSRVSHPSPGFFFTGKKDDSYVVSHERMKNGWTIAFTVSEKEIFSSVNRLIYNLLIVFLTGFLLAIILAYYFSKYVTLPVKVLLEKFRLATSGDLSARTNIQSNDEMQELSSHFNQMMKSLEYSFDELETAGKKLSIEKERAQESDSLKSSFLENLSHEIRTPLMAIVGFSELMADPASTNKERQEFFSHVAYNSNLLVRFIEDTLLFSQLEKGQTLVRKTHFKVREVLCELKEEFDIRREKEKPHLYFRILSGDCDTLIYSDSALLQRLMRYLLDNAFKFTDSGGVTMVCRKTDTHFEIHVSDSGIGISDDKTSMVFRKFCKAIESHDRAYDGAGIGLTNARGIAMLLNGTIELSSKRGEGTIITVSFPLGKH